MERPSTASWFSVMALTVTSGCALLDDPGSSSPQGGDRVCAESVTPDGRGDPRNINGRVRECWPGEARCFCDANEDCYRRTGYVPCAPRLAPVTTAPVEVTGPEEVTDDSGTADAAPVDAGPRDTGVRDAVPRDAVPRDTGAPDAPPMVVTPQVMPPPAVTTGLMTPSSGLRAFPGAEGFGAAATGGRGGRVIYVTNLAASGPGSFQDALQQTGPRYILFRVSGVINDSAWIKSGDVTIAGQTSPAGVTVRGLHTTEANYCDQQCGPNARGLNNFIVRHLRTRPSQGDFPDALRVRYARNGVFDHVSMGNALDEAVEISYANNITIQDSILAETIGDHAEYGGMLINYTNPAAGYALDNLSIVRNTWNRILGRMPEFSRESGSAAAGTTMRVELVNNLLWDQRYFIDVNPTNISGSNAGSAVFFQMNWVGNSSFSSASNRFGTIWMQPSGAGTSAYFNDNRSNLWSGRQDWDLNYCCNDFNGRTAARPSWGRTARHAFPTATVMPSGGVRAYAFANAGAFPRDPMDRRLMAHVNAGTFDGRAINVNPSNDALALNYTGAAPAAPIDTDNDGMPDAWETAKGLNPSAQDHNGTSVSMPMTGVAGYTNLECYLNELAAIRVRDNR